MIDLIANATNRFFIDANVLVYASDRSEPIKRSIARRLLADLVKNGNGVLSVQVLGEYFSIVTRRIPNPLSVGEATSVIDQMESLEVLNIDIAMVRRAIATHSRYGTTYWDSLIIAAAERADCSAILSEDFNSGQSYHGILAVNPFVSASQ